MENTKTQKQINTDNRERNNRSIDDVWKNKTRKMIDPNRKFILDACCGGRMFWFNKKHPNTLYIDNRVALKGHRKHQPQHEVKPDVVMDFRDICFPGKTFKLVVFDPPHLKSLRETSDMRKTYGCLVADTWRYDLGKGFEECWRVLDDYGILIFKWNESEISVKDVLKLFPVDPLFGHPTGSKSKTHWFCFMKIPKKE